MILACIDTCGQAAAQRQLFSLLVMVVPVAFFFLIGQAAKMAWRVRARARTAAMWRRERWAHTVTP